MRPLRFNSKQRSQKSRNVWSELYDLTWYNHVWHLQNTMPCQKRLVILSLSTPSPPQVHLESSASETARVWIVIQPRSLPWRSYKIMVRWNKTLGFIKFSIEARFCARVNSKKIGSEDVEARGRLSTKLHISVWSDITHASFRTRGHIDMVTFMCERSFIPNSQRKPTTNTIGLRRKVQEVKAEWNILQIWCFYDHLRINDVYHVCSV